ncbi:integrase, partial [Burkholderia pseudomallei]
MRGDTEPRGTRSGSASCVATAASVSPVCKQGAWAFSQHADTDLALKALRRAYDHRRPPPGLMFHSDQGCQYTSTRFLAELRARGTIQSMSRRGNCWDNAVVERFFRSLKNEWIGDQLYVDHRHAEQDITDYLVDFYNH